MALNINPSEMNSRICFEIAGYKYSIDDHGMPDDRAPSAAARWKIIASNPVAAALFFDLFIRSFCKTFIGWPVGAACQVSLKIRDCNLI